MLNNCRSKTAQMKIKIVSKRTKIKLSRRMLLIIKSYIKSMIKVEGFKNYSLFKTRKKLFTRSPSLISVFASYMKVSNIRIHL
jgi:hypothetical protein